MGCSTRSKQNQDHSNTETSLRQEINQLETRLQDQFKVRCMLEKALGYRADSSFILSETNNVPMPKPATDLIKDVAVLEMEVIHLEQYLLSLYRKAFEQQTSDSEPKSLPVTISGRCLSFSEDQPTNPLLDDNQNQSKKTEILANDRDTMDLNSQRSAFESKRASPEDSWSKATPLLYMENGENLISLAEHLGTRISDHVSETPNTLSEGMVKCMSEIYCKLAEPTSTLHEELSSSNSSLSSTEFSPSDQYDTSSSGFGNILSFDVEEGERDFSGPYSKVVEVLCIYRDAKKASEVEDLLQRFK